MCCLALALLQAAAVQTAARAAGPHHDGGAGSTVEACPELGPRFVRQPGSDVCLALGGQVLFDVRHDIGDDEIYAETQYILGIPFAIYDVVELPHDTALTKTKTDARVNFAAGEMTEKGPLLAFLSLRHVEEGGETVQSGLDLAFVRFMGFTAGRHRSFFDFSTGLNRTEGYASNVNVDMLAYSHRLGQSATLTVSLEDGRRRWTEDGVWALRGGVHLPDAVVSVRATPDWGSVHAAGAVQELRDVRETECCGRPESELGWAATAGAEYRVKWAGYHGRFQLAGAYAEGALSYLGPLPFATDYIVDVDASLAATRGASLLFAYEHVWRPDLKSAVTLSGYWTETTTALFDWQTRGLLLTLGTEYMPVPNLMLGAELNYFADSVRGTYFDVAGERDTVDFWRARGYVVRNF